MILFFFFATHLTHLIVNYVTDNVIINYYYRLSNLIYILLYNLHLHLIVFKPSIYINRISTGYVIAKLSCLLWIRQNIMTRQMSIKTKDF